MMSDAKRCIPLATAAAPGEAQGAPRPSATNRTAPVQAEARAAVAAGGSTDLVATGQGFNFNHNLSRSS